MDLVLIAGGSASGKTTLAMALAEKLGAPETALISLDFYYHSLKGFSAEGLLHYNFDHPGSIDHALLLDDVSKMLSGHPVTIPQYDYRTHLRLSSGRMMAPSQHLVIEGLFTLYFEDLRRLSDMKVYVDTGPDIRLKRRIRRDTAERGYTVEEVMRQYTATVKPMHDAFIEPTRAYADIVIPGTGGFEGPVETICSMLEDRGRRRSSPGI
jgi:uridine kinase